MKTLARIDKGWVKCRECGHKLFKITDEMTEEVLKGLQNAQIEIKCHSCKAINEVRQDG